MLRSQTALQLFQEKVRYFFRKRQDLTVDELCKRFDSDLNFGLKPFEPRPVTPDSDQEFLKVFKFNKVSKNVWTFFNCFLVFLWLVSGFCVGLYVIQLYENRDFIDFQEISLAAALAFSLAVIGAFYYTRGYLSDHLVPKILARSLQDTLEAVNARTLQDNFIRYPYI